MSKIQLFIAVFLFGLLSTYAQQAGPVIKDFGKVFKVDTDFNTNTEGNYSVVFDVGRTGNSPEKRNALIETAARFLNMHAQNGVPIERMKVALVIHGPASQDILNNTAYTKKQQSRQFSGHTKKHLTQQFSGPNPNSKLIRALHEAGVQIILCGQTAAYRKINKTDVLPEVQFALSAMTALVQLQNEGYRLINF